MYENVSSHIEHLAGQLRQALAAEDWAKIRQLDEDVRQRFALWEQSAKTMDPAQTDMLRESIQCLVVLYRQAVDACDMHREHLRHELQGVQPNRNGVQVNRLV